MTRATTINAETDKPAARERRPELEAEGVDRVCAHDPAGEHDHEPDGARDGGGGEHGWTREAAGRPGEGTDEDEWRDIEEVSLVRRALTVGACGQHDDGQQ